MDLERGSQCEASPRSMPFNYEPLDIRALSIRLLSLAPSSSSKTIIRCTLLRASLATSVKYIALSYTWGDLLQRLVIEVNCCRFEVTRNLEAALRYLRDGEDTLTFWIDAVCINQADHQERSQQ